jgi:nitrogen regulatory protein PII
MVLMLADGARLDAVRSQLRALGVPGYTVLAVEEGRGRTGVHAGDRVHPGALAMVIVVDEDGNAVRLFEALAKSRDLMGDDVSRLFLVPVERQA